MKNKKYLIGLMIIAILLAGCNIPTETEPDEDLVATQVAINLTETALAVELIPTETPEPSPTLVEATPTEAAPPTETPTPTPDDDDPAQRLGDPAFVQDFTGAASPWDFESDQAVFRTENGYLNLTARLNPNWHSWRVFSPVLRNAYVEATVEFTNCAGRDRFGLAVRSTSDGQQFYYMAVTCNEQWGFFRMTPGVNIEQIIAYQTADVLTDGLDEPLRLGIWMEGTNFTLFINGQEVGSASDSALTEEGYTGFLIAFANTPGFTVRVDKLQSWNLR